MLRKIYCDYNVYENYQISVKNVGLSIRKNRKNCGSKYSVLKPIAAHVKYLHPKSTIVLCLFSNVFSDLFKLSSFSLSNAHMNVYDSDFETNLVNRTSKNPIIVRNIVQPSIVYDGHIMAYGGVNSDGDI